MEVGRSRHHLVSRRRCNPSVRDQLQPLRRRSRLGSGIHPAAGHVDLPGGGRAEYHDFYGPSQIWVNISHDGGTTFGPPQEVLASPAVTPGAVAGTLVPRATRSATPFQPAL